MLKTMLQVLQVVDWVHINCVSLYSESWCELFDMSGLNLNHD